MFACSGGERLCACAGASNDQLRACVAGLSGLRDTVIYKRCYHTVAVVIAMLVLVLRKSPGIDSALGVRDQ